MKIVLNKCFGGFCVNEEVAQFLGVDPWDGESLREDKRLIELIEKHGSEFVSETISCLEVVEIPDTTTDWMVDEYDGLETITYVVDGKLHHG